MDERVSELQQSLCRAAKADKSRKFHSLYDKLYRADVLGESWNRVRANKGTAGIDGKEIEDVEREGVQAFLSQISKELKEKTHTITIKTSVDTKCKRQEERSSHSNAKG